MSQPARAVGALLLVAAAGSWTSGTAPAQVSWQKLHSPGPRTSAVAAFDPVRDRLVMFGGWHSGVRDGETWEWDGSRWEHRTPAVSPGVTFVREEMIYDPVAARCLFLGGTGGPVEEWHWDGQTWVRQPTAPPRMGSLAWDTVTQRPILAEPVINGNIQVWEKIGMTWSLRPTSGAVPSYSGPWTCDAARGRMVLPADVYNLVYELAGSTWHAITPSVPRINSYLNSLTFDPRLGEVVKFAGYRAGPTNLLESWNGTRWQQYASGPAPRERHVAAFDSVRRQLLVFGGQYDQFAVPRYGDLWAWDGSWSLLEDHVAPGHLTNHAHAYDSRQGLVVLFGGSTGTQRSHETWLFDGARWRRDLSPEHPPAREHAAMACDGAAGRIVLFGGEGASGLLGDTWVLDAAGWQQLGTVNAPSARRGARMAFDSVRGVTVLFGGEVAGQLSGETWELTGNQWVLRQSLYPPASAFGGLAFDARRGRTVQYSGNIATQTFEWDGQNWFSTNPLHRPPVTNACAMTWDAARARCVLLEAVPGLSVTWEWDGSDWLTTGSSPVSLLGRSVVYHGGREQCVLLPQGSGGYDTWFRGSVRPGRWNVFGTRCSGGGAAPDLQPTRDARPWIGDSFPLELRNAGSLAAVLAFGASDTSWNGVPLPLDLTPGGMPGCWLWASPEIVVPMSWSQGTATLSLAIPADPSLVQAVLFGQGYALAPGANAVGIVTSAGGRAQIGAR